VVFHIPADNSLRFFGRRVALNGVYAVNYVYDGGALANVTVIFIDVFPGRPGFVYLRPYLKEKGRRYWTGLAAHPASLLSTSPRSATDGITAQQ